MKLYEVEKIVAERVRNNKTEYFVKWVGYPNEKNTWESSKNLKTVKDLIAKFKKGNNDQNEISSDSEPLSESFYSQQEERLEEKLEKQKLKKINKSELPKLVVTGLSLNSEGRYIYQVEIEGEKPKWVEREFFKPNYAEELCEFFEERLIILEQ